MHINVVAERREARRRVTLAAEIGVAIFEPRREVVSEGVFDTGTDRPNWMGTVDFSGLKMKLIASIVAISGIHLLKVFMEVGKSAAPVDVEKMRWLVIIHLTFVVSGVLLALMDWTSAKTEKH